MTDAPIRNLGREKPREKVELSELESLGAGRGRAAQKVDQSPLGK